MSDAHNTPDDDGPHEGPIKTPKQLAVAVFFAITVPIIVIVLLAVNVTSAPRPAAGSDGLLAEATARRIQPVGAVVLKDASGVAVVRTGEQVFGAQCSACHNAGALGAPKVGDTAAWAPRLGQGYAGLLTSALKGKGAMTAQAGGNASDYEIGRAVVYMANQSGAKFDEPPAPAAAASGAAAEPASAPAK